MENINQVLHALEILYRGHDSGAKSSAAEWLQQFQKTKEAWTISNAILRDNGSEAHLEYKIFAAQTLRSKVIHDFRDLDPTSGLGLKESLIGYLQETEKIIPTLRRQINLVLADLAVQLLEWEDPVVEMIQRFLIPSQQQEVQRSEGGMIEILEFLTVLPEELMNNERIILSGEKLRVKKKKLLDDVGEDVLGLLVRGLESEAVEADIQVKILECFRAWMSSGGLKAARVHQTPLIELAFAGLRSEDDEVMEVAVEAICGYIYESSIEKDMERRGREEQREREGKEEGEEMEDKREEVEDLNIEYLKGKLQEMAGNMEAIVQGEVDRMRGVCRIFTEAGEAWIREIVRQPERFLGILEALVGIMQIPQLEVLPMTFNFWGELAEKVVEVRQRTGDKEKQRIMEQVFAALVEAVIVDLRYPLDYDGFRVEGKNEGSGEGAVWTAKDRDDFSDFRHSIGDVLKEAVNVLGQAQALMHPYNILQQQMEARRQGRDEAWQVMEAALFALRAMGSEISDEEEVVMPKIMQVVGTIDGHAKLQYGAILVMSRYTFWTRRHVEYIAPQLAYISAGFENQQVATASTQALKYLCKDCGEYLVGHWHELEAFYSKVVQLEYLDEDDVVDLTEGFSHTVGRLQDISAFSAAVERFCSAVMQDLGQDVGAAASADYSRMARLLVRMSTFLRHLDANRSEAFATVVMQAAVGPIWPVVISAVEQHGHRSEVSEACGRLLRVLVTVTPRVVPEQLVSSALQILARGFVQTGYSVYIWAGRKIIEEFEIANNANRDAIQQQYDEFVQTISGAMTSLVTSSAAVTTGIDQYPEQAEEYFLLCMARFHNDKRRLLFLLSQQQQQQQQQHGSSDGSLLVHFAIEAISSIHYYVTEAALEFWSAILSFSAYYRHETAHIMRKILSINTNLDVANNNSNNNVDNTNTITATSTGTNSTGTTTTTTTGTITGTGGNFDSQLKEYPLLLVSLITLLLKNKDQHYDLIHLTATNITYIYQILSSQEFFSTNPSSNLNNDTTNNNNNNNINNINNGGGGGNTESQDIEQSKLSFLHCLKQQIANSSKNGNVNIQCDDFLNDLYYHGNAKNWVRFTRTLVNFSNYFLKNSIMSL